MSIPTFFSIILLISITFIVYNNMNILPNKKLKIQQVPSASDNKLFYIQFSYHYLIPFYKIIPFDEKYFTFYQYEVDEFMQQNVINNPHDIAHSNIINHINIINNIKNPPTIQLL